MQASSNVDLTLLQKVRLAASIFAIYWPLRFYINLNSFDWELFQALWFIWLLEIPITIALFTFWLIITEWLENRLYSHSGRLFRLDGKLSVQIATLLIAGTLSVGFDWAFFRFLHQVRGGNNTQIQVTSGRSSLARPIAEEAPGSFFSERRRGRKAVTALTVMALLMAFYVAANRRGDNLLGQLRVNAEQLKREASEAQFAALKNQVNPHFLFNSLSILTALVEVNPKLSIRFINYLSKAYRYILDQRENQRVNLNTELEFLEAYCFLLNIRFDGKLQVVNTISTNDAIRYTIAPLTLQLLVENAVKHNQMSRKMPLIVTLVIESDYLLVSNPVRLRLPDEPSTDTSTGVGLENITNRYRLLTERPVRVTQSNQVFVVSIPLLA
ncbi:histidine kinase [Larkinella arboricola]|uniref:Histidine kinase n=1 Tax=Larkinella arboricola TaxID=643671 RepID=A0A327WG38_LARAB|nr:histidine kinase [Larkinella arboricola]RAJ89888.1 histidine kinase [Larkinella arboricola]